MKPDNGIAHVAGSERWGAVPLEYVAALKRKPTALAVFVVLAAHADKVDGRCFPHRATIAMLTDLRGDAVSFAINYLFENWFVDRVKKRSGNEYRLVSPAERSAVLRLQSLVRQPGYVTGPDIQPALNQIYAHAGDAYKKIVHRALLALVPESSAEKASWLRRSAAVYEQ